ncbi:DUF1501 domain-containing protein [Croceibacterium ferulae]|uniref:DUF1501 domain-containing protein n=1 Tax=Croceibacterium ferulae TaxID=1854641 RepID=UPI0030C7E037
MAGIGEAAAFSSAGGYKALVCVFLSGGNDHANTLIPYDEYNYRQYRAIRGASEAGGVALSHDSLIRTALVQPTDQILTDDLRYALAPTMPLLKARFDEGHLAPVLNVGPLLAPLTKAQYNSKSPTFPRPPKLFSHNDQQSTWQSFQPEGARSGWGGRMGDLATANNRNAMFTLINATGNAVFLAGEQAFPYKIGPNGAVLVNALKAGKVYGSAASSVALEAILRSHENHVLSADYAAVNTRALDYGGFVVDAMSRSSLKTKFPSDNSLASQLSAVARLIAARESLGVTRQVFMVSLGGFDNHDNLLGKHQNLLGKIDGALDAFYCATMEMGLTNQVTTFTASDFGRTLTSNGNGSDHGWGAHHFVLGGAVRGGRYYGQAPQISISSNDQVGQGRLLPTTSVDQYSATLAQWFGVAASELPSVAPNIGRFETADCGFMAPQVPAPTGFNPS